MIFDFDNNGNEKIWKKIQVAEIHTEATHIHIGCDEVDTIVIGYDDDGDDENGGDSDDDDDDDGWCCLQVFQLGSCSRYN